MKRTSIVMILFLSAMLVWVPYTAPTTFNPSSQVTIEIDHDTQVHMSPSQVLEQQTGTLNPVLIEHFGAASMVQPYELARTDTDSTPGSEAFSPIGAQGNLHSADCDGGHFLVGVGGSCDFGSSQGTISLWIKWDVDAPNGRFWGQHYDFETRWSSNRFTLDWGGDNTLIGTKTDWVSDHWYFLAITWDDGSNQIALYWGDEEAEPVEDASTSTWTGSVVGYHTENDIMSSAARTTTQVDGHVDEFRYFTVARSLEDIVGDYRITLSGTEPNLANYYRFENDMTDSSGDEDLVATGSSSFSSDVFLGEDGWRAEQIEISIRDLNLLYALNGTFDSGLAGANVDWSGDGTYYATGWRAQREYEYYPGRQRAVYVETDRKYVVLENEGYEVTSPNGYRHYNGTRIFWYQTVDNDQLEDEFEFSMDYLYQRGPIGTNFIDIFEFSFEVLNGSTVLWNWSIDPTNISQRGVWYTTDSIDVQIPDAPSTFEVRIILKVNSSSSYIQIPEDDADLDGDSANGQFVTFFIDDVSFTGMHPPDPQEVALGVDLSPIGTHSISGTSGQSVILLNYSFWERASIPFEFLSNSTISFDYSSRISKMTRYCFSKNTTNSESDGVSYSIELGESSELSLYTYIQSYPEATDIGIIVHYPSDWINPQVADPLGQDISQEIIVDTNQLTIPSGFADSVGWWKIEMNGPNYADLVSIQLSGDSSWTDQSIFNNGDRIRCKANIGTDLYSVKNVTNVELTWYLPSGDIWLRQTAENPNNSIVTGQGTTLGPVNATVGVWLVSVSWSNGTEVGYGFANFELFHSFTFFAHTPSMEIEADEQFTIAVYLYDQANGNPILSDAEISGNWSMSVKQFNPNLAKGWWEADFNATGLASGEYAIVVDVVMPFFEMSSTTITIRIPDAESFYALTLRAGLLGASIVVIAVIAVSVSRRFYKTIMSKRNLELLVLESRLEDAKNLLGLLVIHRAIGLPVYSKILKGGFQEALLSSFISAISNFRAEFSMDEPTWTAIPITEVITAVQTESLICAIITIESASSRQRTRLEAFSREVGGLYDHENDTMRTMVRSSTISSTFDSIFESYFDAQLIKRYVGVKKTLPRHLNSVSVAFTSMDIDHGVTVEALIKATSVLGYSERSAHNMVFEAVDDGHLIVAEERLPPPISFEE